MPKPQSLPTPRELLETVRSYFNDIESVLDAAAEAESLLTRKEDESARLTAEIETKQERLDTLNAKTTEAEARTKEAQKAMIDAQLAQSEAEKQQRQQESVWQRAFTAKRDEAEEAHQAKMGEYAQTEADAKARVDVLEGRLRALRDTMERTIDRVMP